MNTQEPNTAPTVEALTELIAGLLGGTYHCTRVWEAWNVGTMSQEDFCPVDESDTPREIAEAVLALLAAPQPAQSLPFGVGGALAAIKTLLGRDPCTHATVAIEMIDAVLAAAPQPSQGQGLIATLAGLEASIGHLSAIVDQQRALLAEVDDVFGRDERGIPFEDGESSLIDKVRAHLACIAAPQAAQSAPEPFATVSSFNDCGGTYDLSSPPKYRPPVGAPIYAAPPRRQPLTDQEIDDLYINGTRHWIGKREVARAVEALITSKGPA